jgi:hypothetical protein
VEPSSQTGSSDPNGALSVIESPGQISLELAKIEISPTGSSDISTKLDF